MATNVPGGECSLKVTATTGGKSPRIQDAGIQCHATHSAIQAVVCNPSLDTGNRNEKINVDLGYLRSYDGIQAAQ